LTSAAKWGISEGHRPPPLGNIVLSRVGITWEWVLATAIAAFGAALLGGASGWWLQRGAQLRHRGRGCDQPGRSAKGLQRAAVLGLRLIAEDDELQAAMRDEIAGHFDQAPDAGPSRVSLLASLTQKRRKLLDLHYGDHITGEAFAQEEARLSGQIDAL
jgi:hypothetical protein